MDTCSTQCLKLRHPFVLAVQQLIISTGNNNIHVAHSADHRWYVEWLDKYQPARLRTFITDTSTHRLGMTLPITAWVRLNCLRTSVGGFLFCLHKWGMASSVAFECYAEEQTVEYVVLHCPLHRLSHGLHGLTVVDDETIDWLLNTCPYI